jgi:hypothetical protein
VPITSTESLVSPRLATISISLCAPVPVFAVTPGANAPPDPSSVRPRSSRRVIAPSTTFSVAAAPRSWSR